MGADKASSVGTFGLFEPEFRVFRRLDVTPLSLNVLRYDSKAFREEG